MARITAKMSVMDITAVMANGNPGAVAAAMEMMSSIEGLDSLFTCDEFGIYGTELYMLWNDSCKRDLSKVCATVQAFREGKFTEEEIHKNLTGWYAKPFI